MNNVNTVPIDIDEMRNWALGYIEDAGLSRSQMAKQSGIPMGTLGPWLNSNYAGPDENIARRVLAYKQKVETSRKISDALPVNPGYFDTPTSIRFEKLLSLAHTGRIAVIGTGPGTGKTMAIREYAQKAPDVFVATIKPSNGSLGQMITEVMIAIGILPRRLRAADASREVVKKLSGTNALLVIDEANHLKYEAIDELRAWHDELGIGLCLAGNDELIREIRQGRHKDAFARLNSRIARVYDQQQQPTPDDVTAFCDAWGIHDPAIRNYLRKIGTHRDAGGLRECRQLIEMASYIAAEEERGLTLLDLQQVQATRGSRWIKA